MSEDEINIAIAGACGWVWDFNDAKEVRWLNKAKPFRAYPSPPNYCCDQDAMMDALASLPLESRDGFVLNLARVIDPGCPDPDSFHPFTWITAKARHLAQAFVLTIKETT